MRRWAPSALAASFAIALILLLAFPVGFSAQKADPTGDGYFQRLSEGFLHGELSIRERPPRWLLRAEDPYDPATSARFRVYGTGDAALANGRIYYTWGPAPVVLVSLPLRAVGIHATETHIGIFSLCAVVIFLCLMVRRLSERWPMHPFTEWALAMSLSVVFSGFVLLRRVAIWEGSILFAAACGAAAVYFYLSAFIGAAGSERAASRAKRTWLLGGVSLALAIGARVTYIVYLTVPIGLLAALVFRQRTRRRTGGEYRKVGKVARNALVPPAAGLLLLGVYNQMRFGSPLDVGQTRALTGYNQATMVLSSVRYTAPNIYYYVFRPPSWTPVFPFVSFDKYPWPGKPPLDYVHPEPVAGFLWTSPVLVVGLTMFVLLVMSRRLRSDVRASAATIFLLGAAVQLVVLSTIIYGATQRYRLEMDLLLSAAAACAISLALSAAPRWGRRVVTASLCLALIIGVPLAALGAQYGVYPFRTVRNDLANRAESLMRPLEQVALRTGPFVLVEPHPDYEWPLRLDEPFALSPTSLMRTFGRGGCPVRIVLRREKGDAAPITVTAEGAQVIDRGRTLEVLVEAQPRKQVIGLSIDRDDNRALTKFAGGTSQYACS